MTAERRGPVTGEQRDPVTGERRDPVTGEYNPGMLESGSTLGLCSWEQRQEGKSV